MIWQFIVNGLITCIFYSLLVIGFALVYNTKRIFHIAATGIYVFAACMFLVLRGQGLPPRLSGLDYDHNCFHGSDEGHLLGTILIGEKFFVVDAISRFKR